MCVSWRVSQLLALEAVTYRAGMIFKRAQAEVESNKCDAVFGCSRVTDSLELCNACMLRLY